jgi:UDP-GlcNAc:undecaprenyl-phosphate/decaprenyl-phosphate GlcNAc-1-phosphate transferase
MQYVLPFILAMVVTMAGLPLFVRAAGKWKIIDLPGERKVHTSPVPRVGGLAMAAGVLIAALLTMNLQWPDRWFLIAAGTLIAFGAWDDWADLDYRIKLVGQLLAVGVVVVLGDVQIRTLTLDDSVALPSWVSAPLTVLFLVGITNAINLADGLDGLAGGTTFLCLCAVGLLSSVGDSGASTALAAAFAGAVLGFLRFNTYPASVFMGDAGSQLLGFAIGVLSVRATQSGTTQISAALPVLLLALPILDTLSVMAQRIREGRSPFSADRNHIHHKLLSLGFEHHEAVMVIYAIQGALFVTAYSLRFESDLLILGVAAAFFVISVSAYLAAKRGGWQLRQPKAAGGVPARQQLIDAPKRPNLLPQLTKAAIAVALAAYAACVVAETTVLSGDLRILIAALLAAIIGSLIIMRTAPLGVAEKSVLFVTAAVLVYLDAVVLHPGRLMSTLCWVAVSLAALATAVRLRLLNDRRFRVTPLDLIVVFMALVVPSLPGTLRLPQGGALAIAKVVIVFYAIELLVSRADERAVWVRVATASVLAGLALRSLAVS